MAVSSPSKRRRHCRPGTGAILFFYVIEDEDILATASEALSTALDLHMSGRQAEAETLYRRILDAAPDQSDALHLLGLLLAPTAGPDGWSPSTPGPVRFCGTETQDWASAANV